MQEISIFEYLKKQNQEIFFQSINNIKIFYSNFDNSYVDTYLHTLITRDNYIFNNFDRYLSSNKYRKYQKPSFKFDHNKNSPKLKIINNPSIYFGAENNYWHLLRDFIPKIFAIKEIIKKKKIQIILNKNLNKKSLNIINFFLKKLDIDNLEFKKIENGIYTFKKLFFIQRPSLQYSVIFFNFFNKFYPSVSKNIYISRKKAMYRKLINEEELIIFLKKYNYEIINCEELKLEDQIKIFSQAKNILAPHGAGLTNLFWVQKGANIIELSSENPQPFYFELSQLKKLNFFRIIGKNFFNDSNINRNDFIVDLKLVEKILLKYQLH